MTLSQTFRLSFYSSLIVSCLTLFYGEWDFLPGATIVFSVLIGFMVYACWHEGQGYMNERIANRIGVVIGVLTILWVVARVPRTEQDLIAGGVPWPAAMVPLLAPLLPILLVVKLFRPKSLADFWVFQTISMVIVTLACILAGELAFFVLLVVFLVSQLWCMTLFFLYKQKLYGEQPDLDPHRFPLFGKRDGADRTPTPLAYLGLRRALRWAAPVVLMGLGLFFVLPRFTDSQWVPNKLSAAGKVIMKTGISGSGMDLYREGMVEISDDPAFEVQAFNNQGKTVFLPPTQRWRMQVFDTYDHGNWTDWASNKYLFAEKKALPSQEHLEANLELKHDPKDPPDNLGDAEVYLYYEVNPTLTGGLPLADPVASDEQVGMYPWQGEKPSVIPFIKRISEAEVFQTRKKPNTTVRYGQIIIPSLRAKQTPSRHVTARYRQHLALPYATANMEVPEKMHVWTRKLLAEVSGLADADRVQDEYGLIPAEKHARVAEAFCRYLGESGRYSYTLKLRFADKTEDPTVDFLMNVHEGHCERFAAGLALMLRSLRIPARIVRGFHGYERLDNGRHLVKMNMAHAWVEVLAPGDKPGSWVWLELDPTPVSGDQSDSMMPVMSWFWNRVSNPQFLWKNMIMEYNQDRQSEAGGQLRQAWDRLTSKGKDGTSYLDDIWDTVRWPGMLLALFGTMLLAYWSRKLFVRGSSRQTGQPADFYANLLKVLARRRGLRPAAGQTPLEFAQHASRAMIGTGSAQQVALPPAWADLPVRVAKLLYRVRYSASPVPAEECVALERQVAELDSLLCQSPRH